MDSYPCWMEFLITDQHTVKGHRFLLQKCQHILGSFRGTKSIGVTAVQLDSTTLTGPPLGLTLTIPAGSQRFPFAYRKSSEIQQMGF